MVFGEDLGVNRETCVQVSTAFGGGMAHLGLTCGAVTGALMVLGLRHGGTGGQKQATYGLATEFVKRLGRPTAPSTAPSSSATTSRTRSSSPRPVHGSSLPQSAWTT